jgi:4-amino-4-deoxychorismate lyase
MAEKILINGIATSEISSLDRGLQYGDGVFETVSVQNSKLLCWDEHISRLESGCKRLNITFPDSETIKEEALTLVENKQQAVVKIIITRGVGGRGYASPETQKPNRIISVYPFPEYPEENTTKGITVHICEHRYGQNPALAGIKHLNRLEQVLARSEWTSSEIAEGFVLDQDNNVIEGTMSNVFLVKGNVLSTPDLTNCGVEGIIRNKIIELLPTLNINFEERNISLTELNDADEIFICNSVIGVWPVTKLNDITFPIGEKTQQIKKLLQDSSSITS